MSEMTLPRLFQVLSRLQNRAARSLGGRGRCVLLDRAGDPGCEVVEPRLLDPAVVEALSGACGTALLSAVRRTGTPLQIATEQLPTEACELAASLSVAGVERLALLPLGWGGGVAGVLVLTNPEVEPPGVEAGQEGPLHVGVDTSDLAALWVEAGALMLGQIVERGMEEGGPVPHGGIVVDDADRILFAFGAAWDLPGWAHEELMGQPIARLPLGEALTALARNNATGARWSEHGVWTEWDEIPVAVGGQRLAGGVQLVLLRDQRLDASEGGAATRELAELLLELVHAIDDSTAEDPEERPALTPALQRIVAGARDALVFGDRAGAPRHLDLNRTFRGWMTTHAGSLRKEGVRVLSLLAPELSAADGDRTDLGAALRGLLDHARDALRPHGGTITLRTWEDDGYLHAAVSDDASGAGRGAPSVGFVPLYPGVRDEDRTGARLARARRRLEGIEGRLDIDVRPRVWTRRTVLVPAAASSVEADSLIPEAMQVEPTIGGRLVEQTASEPTVESPPATSGASDGARPASQTLRVLVVDDNAALRRIVRKYLERRGHRVSEAADGDEALALVKEHGFDRLLIDLHMPGRTGRDVFEALADLDPELQSGAVFMSGGSTESDLLRFLAGCGRPEIQKPFDLKDVAQAVEG